MTRIWRYYEILTLAAACFAGPSAIAGQLPAPDPFDKPLKKVVVNYDLSGSVLKRVSCSYYPAFMVKEYDTESKGGQWHGIVPVVNHKTPVCDKNLAPGELTIANDPGGYLRGVKANLVFINGMDGYDGGIDVYAYDSATGKNIFQDCIHEPSNDPSDPAPFQYLRFNHSSDGHLAMRYFRVLPLGCDLLRGRKSCWDAAQKKIPELQSVPMPVCEQYEDLAGTDTDPSVVGYPVEVVLTSNPTITRLLGPVKCWPAE
jgi:hypothetical protein